MRNPFGWDLPPGCTHRDIDDAVGADRPKVKVKAKPTKFPGIGPGDVLSIIYHGAQASLIQVTKVNQYSVEGRDGEASCKLTWVSERDMRFYASLGPNRQSVLRPVQYQLLDGDQVPNL